METVHGLMVTVPSDPALLLPPAMALVAPSSDLAAAARKGGDSDPLAELTGRLEGFAQIHRPRMEEAARRANAQLGTLSDEMRGRVGDLVRETRDAAKNPAARRKFRERYGKYVLIGGGIFLVLVAAGWELACRSASEVADRRVREALALSGFEDTVTIDRVTASPFGTVTLNGVKVLNPRQIGATAVNIASLSLDGLDRSGHIPAALSFSATGVKVDLPQARWVFGTQALCGRLLALGYTTIDGKLAGSYALSGKTLSLDLSAKFPGVGGYDVSATLQNVPSAIRTLFDSTGVSGISQFNPLVLLSIGQEASQAALSDLKIRVDAMELARREAAIPDTSLPVAKEASSSLQGATPLTRFMVLGGNLSMHAHPDQPIPLMRPGMFGGQFNTELTNLQTIARASHADVSVTTP